MGLVERKDPRGGSRNFVLGGSKLWFRKDCFVANYFSPHPLQPVAEKAETTTCFSIETLRLRAS